MAIIAQHQPNLMDYMGQGIRTGMQQGASGSALAQLLGLGQQGAQQLSQLPQAMQQSYADKAMATQSAIQVAAMKNASKSGELITPQRQELVKNTIGNYLDLLKKGNIGMGEVLKTTNPQVREDRANFDGLALGIESTLMPLVNKGTLAKPRFDFIMSRVPSAMDTKATIVGKLKALSSMFGVDFNDVYKNQSSDKTSPQSDSKQSSGEKIRIVDPKNPKKSYLVPPEDAEKATKAGWKKVK